MNTDKSIGRSIEEVAAEEAEAKGPDYASMSYNELIAEMVKAVEVKDLKLVGKISRMATQAEQAVEKAKRDALQAVLATTTENTMRLLDTLVNFMVGGTPDADAVKAFYGKVRELKGNELDAADGVWFSRDFGDAKQTGTCRITKSTGKASSAGDGGSSGKGSYVPCNIKSSELLARVGSNVYLKVETKVRIDSQDHVLPLGTTFDEAYKFSTNGGWRNRVVMALRKEAGVI